MKAKFTLSVSLVAVGLLLTVAPSAIAQGFQLLHTFEGTDGRKPGALTIDSAGNLYGSAVEGGILNCSSPGHAGCGTIFELSLKNAQWVFKTAYQFQSDTDGWSPNSPVTAGPEAVSTEQP